MSTTRKPNAVMPFRANLKDGSHRVYATGEPVEPDHIADGIATGGVSPHWDAKPAAKSKGEDKP